MTTVEFQPYKWECDDGESLNKRETPEDVDLKESYTTIYIHGLDTNNKTVSIKISDFKPWIYLELDEKIDWNPSRIEILGNYLKNRLGSNRFLRKKFVIKNKIYYMKPGKFLWMTFHNIHGIEQLKKTVFKPVTVYGLGTVKLTIHENQRNASPILKLQAMKKLYPSGWLSVKGDSKERFSTAEIEIQCSYQDLTAITKDAVINPLVLSYDIECVSADITGMTFPDPTRKTDPCIVISATVGRYFDTKWESYSLVNESGGREIKLANVFHFKGEKELLIGWKDFINRINPDVIVSYNGLIFDDNYIAERASVLGIFKAFSTMGRLIGVSAKRCERKWTSSAYGDQMFKYLDIPGRLHIDMFPVISKEFTDLSGYRLEDVSAHFLKEHKIDLPARDMIIIYHEGGGENMEKIVKYCNQDTLLPFKLMKHLNSWISLIEMSNVMRIQMFDLVTRGQQVRVFSQLYCDIYDKNFVCQAKWDDYKPTDDDKEFVGATVQNPRVGLWELVATFDFKSLYPTTIIAYNLCFSTFIPDGENPPEESYHRIEVDSHQGCEHDFSERKTKVARKICKTEVFRFYKAEIRKGLIPSIIENTLSAREKAKKEMKLIGKKIEESKSEDEKNALKIMYTVFDKRQNGLKINGNSVTGNTPVPCLINGLFEYRTIEELAGDEVWENGEGDNQVLVPKDIKVWSDKGWTDVKYLIRHPVKGDMVRVLTHTGCVDCTPEHSLLRKNGDPVTPDELSIGDELLHFDIELPADTPEFPRYMIFSLIGINFVERSERDAHDIGLNCRDRIPSYIFNSPVNIRFAFFVGYYKLSQRFLKLSLPWTRTQIDTAGLFYIMRSLGYPNVYIKNIVEKGFELHYFGFENTKLISKEYFKYSGKYIYDIETENHHFAAGVGNMIVHNSMYGGFGSDFSDTPFYPAAACTTAMGRYSINNAIEYTLKKYNDAHLIYGDTDSAMFCFRELKNYVEVFKRCHELEKSVNKIFPPPMYLEFENLSQKYLLLKKKNYIKEVINEKGEIVEVIKKGVVSKRRDNCELLRESYMVLVDLVMNKKQIWEIYRFIEKLVIDLLQGRIELSKLIITKSVKDNYKATNLPHLAVANKMKDRGKYVVSGTRIPYIFITTDNYNDPQYKKAEDPDYYLEAGKNNIKMEIDYLYYLDKQITNPVDELLEIRFGKKNVLENLVKLLKKDAVDVEEYFKANFKIEGL
jgi:DNA polymerase elongation subunit (family B)